MSKKIIVIAPHPDDETLGCGGALLKHQSEGDEIHWCILTKIDSSLGYSSEQIQERSTTIESVKNLFKFHTVHFGNFATTKLDQIPLSEIITVIGSIFKKVEPHTVYVPFCGDIHSDHKIAFDATLSCTKWFRYPSIQRVLAYETLSETDQATPLENFIFSPNVFIDISKHLKKKIEIMKTYRTELGEFPFPRSEKAIEALATVRGAASGFHAAEAFQLVKECIS
jgi:N-acetylglucosamine malate deacetylase 1